MKEYDEILKELDIDCIARSIIKKNYGKSIDEIYSLIEMEHSKHISHNWFSGDIVYVYPSIKETKSKKHYESINGTYIGLNVTYINYHALLINVSRGSKYVLRKPLRFELNDILPMNITELEELEENSEIDIPIMRVDKTFKLVR